MGRPGVQPSEGLPLSAYLHTLRQAALPDRLPLSCKHVHIPSQPEPMHAASYPKPCMDAT